MFTLMIIRCNYPPFPRGLANTAAVSLFDTLNSSSGAPKVCQWIFQQVKMDITPEFAMLAQAAALQVVH